MTEKEKMFEDTAALRQRVEDGAPLCRMTLSDITGRKQAEEEREKLQTQLNQAQKMESVGRLAGGVAHDFNNMLRRLIGEDIDLVWKPAPHLWPVIMDTSQIDQILANLCVNTRDAIAGVGKGTGLGLATVYGIVKQNNGFINVYSEPGQGSTFRIYLPRLVADEETDKAVPDKKPAAGGTETILLVEDEFSILRITRLMLERKGYTVLSAAAPSEALEKAKNHSGAIDLLMTDVVMPEMNGRDLAGKITALCPGIKLLFMSGYTADIIAHQGVLDDGVTFIQKPFSMADLAEKLREVLDSDSDKTQG